MRHGSSNRRHRGRNNNGRRNNQPRTQVYDSNGPDVRIRGTAHQVAEKYLALAKDATAADDRSVAENYYQHAEHYIRIINENNGNFSSGKDSDQQQSQSSKDNNNHQKKQEKKVSAEEDLSLPDSILGPDVKTKEKKVEQEEGA